MLTMGTTVEILYFKKRHTHTYTLQLITFQNIELSDTLCITLCNIIYITFTNFMLWHINIILCSLFIYYNYRFYYDEQLQLWVKPKMQWHFNWKLPWNTCPWNVWERHSMYILTSNSQIKYQIKKNAQFSLRYIWYECNPFKNDFMMHQVWWYYPKPYTVHVLHNFCILKKNGMCNRTLVDPEWINLLSKSL